MKGLPKLDIFFNQLADTAVKRSTKGTLALIVIDNTSPDVKFMTYRDPEKVKKTDYSTDNYNYIIDSFRGGASKVIVVKVAQDGNVEEVASPLLNNVLFDWITVASNTKAHQDAVINYVKNKNIRKKYKLKALVYKATNPDDDHIVNFTTESYIVRDAVTKEGYMLLPYLAGVLAGLPFTRSLTYYTMQGIESVKEKEDNDAAVDKGELILFNDEGAVRVARGVNSLVTLENGKTEDMQSIAVIETMDMIIKDINEAFKKYIGAYKNKHDNQALFISAVNGYFLGLSKEDILDPEFANECMVDVEAQRQAWIANGNEDAKNWNDNKVKKRTFKKQVFLEGQIKILDTMEDIKFKITMI